MKIYRIIRTLSDIELRSDRLEDDLRPGCTLNDPDPEEIARFTDRAEAYRALAGYTADVSLMDSDRIARVEEYSVEEFEADEDGAFLSGSDYDTCAWPETLTVRGETYVWDDSARAWQTGWVISEAGSLIRFDAAVQLMDDDIREEIHGLLAPCTNQEFFDEYCRQHRAQYGEDFRVN